GALVGLSRKSLELFETFGADHPDANTGFQKHGLVYACNSDDGLEHTLLEMQIAGDLGVPGQKLDESELRKLAPAITGPIKGGVYFSSEAHAEPLRVVQEMARLAQEQGATIIPSC